MMRDLRDPEVATLIQRHRGFWDGTAGLGPLFRLSPWPVHREYDDPPPAPAPQPYKLPDILDGANFRADIEQRFDRGGLLHDDFINVVDITIMTEVFVGCPVVTSASNWAEPCFTDWHQLDNYRLQDSIWFTRFIENMQLALDAADPEVYPFSCMGIRGPVDMARAFLGGEPLCAAIYEHPGELKDLLARITDIIIAAELAHTSLIPLHDGGQFNHEGVWAPGRNAAFSVDAAWMFSPTCYEEFFLPCDRRICEAFDSTVMHLHSASRQHFRTWAELPKVGLQCSIDEIWLPSGEKKTLGPPPDELIPVFRDMHNRTTLMIDGHWTDELVDEVMKSLPQAGLAVRGSVPDPGSTYQKWSTHWQAELPV